jgi:hypothetical protein
MRAALFQIVPVGLSLGIVLGCQAIYPDLEVSDVNTGSDSATETGTGTGDTSSQSETAGTESAATDSMPDSASATEPDTYSDTGIPGDTGTGEMDTASQTEVSSDSADSGMDTADTESATGNVDTVTETESDTGAPDSETGSGIGTDTETEISRDTGTEPVANCTGAADFTPCNLVTSPEDRIYDVCIGEVCVSPGCGEPDCNTRGPHFNLADSGLRECFSDSGVVDCSVLDAMYDGQDAHFGWDVENAADLRFESSTSSAYPDHPVVADTVTGLMWQGCPAGLTGTLCNSSSAGTRMTWLEAVDYCDTLPWGDYTDWHLPDVYELLSIINFSEYSPAISTDVFPAVPDNDTFWTSTTHAVTPDVRWEINTALGIVYTPSNNDTSAKAFVRCVRGANDMRPIRRFERQSVGGQALVTDYVTGRMWTGCLVTTSTGGNPACAGSVAPDGMDWSSALSFCTSLTWGGLDDWRLPNIMELQSIVDSARYSPAVDETVFSMIPPTRFWTSSTRINVPNNAWYVNLLSGSTGSTELKTSTDSTEGATTHYQHYPLCVRDAD